MLRTQIRMLDITQACTIDKNRLSESQIDFESNREIDADRSIGVDQLLTRTIVTKPSAININIDCHCLLQVLKQRKRQVNWSRRAGWGGGGGGEGGNSHIWAIRECAVQQGVVFASLSLEQGPKISVSLWNRVFFLPIFPTLERSRAYGYFWREYPPQTLPWNCGHPEGTRLLMNHQHRMTFCWEHMEWLFCRQIFIAEYVGICSKTWNAPNPSQGWRRFVIHKWEIDINQC